MRTWFAEFPLNSQTFLASMACLTCRYQLQQGIAGLYNESFLKGRWEDGEGHRGVREGAEEKTLPPSSPLRMRRTSCSMRLTSRICKESSSQAVTSTGLLCTFSASSNRVSSQFSTDFVLHIGVEGPRRHVLLFLGRLLQSPLVDAVAGGFLMILTLR